MATIFALGVSKFNKMPDRQRGVKLSTSSSFLYGINQKGDATIMKKHTRIIFVMTACLAGFIAQSPAHAATTNSVWNVNAVSTLQAGRL